MQNGTTDCVKYRLCLNCTAEKVTALLAKPEILVEKRTKRKAWKTMDIRPAFAGAQVRGTEAGCEMMVTLPTGNDNINPNLLLQALNVANNEEYTMRVMRLELLTADGKPFR